MNFPPHYVEFPAAEWADGHPIGSYEAGNYVRWLVDANRKLFKRGKNCSSLALTPLSIPPASHPAGQYTMIQSPWQPPSLSLSCVRVCIAVVSMTAAAAAAAAATAAVAAAAAAAAAAATCRWLVLTAESMNMLMACPFDFSVHAPPRDRRKKSSYPSGDVERVGVHRNSYHGGAWSRNIFSKVDAGTNW